MVTKKITRSFLVVASLMMLGSPALAADEDLAPASGNNGVPVFSGGIGDDELNYIRSVQHQFDTKVLFTATNGEYLSDLPVTIRNRHGETVVSTVTKGPILLVNLPDGQYVVSASLGDVNREQKISVAGHSLRTYQLRFPSSDLTSDNNN